MSKLGPLLPALLFIVAVTAAKAARVEDPRLVLPVHVFNVARISAAVLTAAENDASQIFQKAGIEIDWIECPESGPETPMVPPCRESWHITLRILANAIKKSSQRALGFPCLPAKPTTRRSSIPGFERFRLRLPTETMETARYPAFWGMQWPTNSDTCCSDARPIHSRGSCERSGIERISWTSGAAFFSSLRKKRN